MFGINRTPRVPTYLASLLWLAMFPATIAQAVARETSLSFQGHLQHNGSPITGRLDLQFALYQQATGGAALDTIERTDLLIEGGYLLADLNFTAIPFESYESAWLEVRIRDANSSGSFSVLTPRQAVRATPYTLSAAHMAPASINNTHIVAGSVGVTHIGNASIASADFAALTVQTSDLADCLVVGCAVETNDLGAGSVGTTKIATNAVSIARLADGAIVDSKLVNASIGTPQLAPSSVTATQIAASAVSGAKIAANAVTGSTIADSAIGNGKIANGTLQVADLATPPGDISNVLTTNGLVGGGPTGSVSVQSDPSQTQMRVLPCGNNQGMSAIAEDGTTNCTPSAGDAITRTTRLEVGPEQPEIILGGDGLPAILYYHADTGELRLLRCSHADCSGSTTTIMLANQGVSSLGISISLGGNGYPLIVYSEIDSNEAWTYMRMIVCTSHDCSGRLVRDLANGTLGFASTTAIGVGDDGRTYVFYTDQSVPNWGLIRCADATCSTSINAAGVLNGGNFDEVAANAIVVPLGEPPLLCYSLTLTNVGGNAIEYARCANDDCSSISATASLAGTIGADTRSCRMALDNEQLPILAWTDGITATTRTLYVRHCNNLDCSGSPVESVTAEGPLVAPSLRIDPSGLPSLAYYDLLVGNIMLAHCLDASCSDFTESMVTGFDDIDSEQTMSLDIFGFPIIVYSHGSSLVVTRCGTRSCL